MRRILLGAAAVLSAWVVVPGRPGVAQQEPSAAPEPPAAVAEVPPGMASFQLVFLMRGPNWTPEPTPEVMALQERHLAHLGRLSEAGKVVLSGPIVDPEQRKVGGLAGILVFVTSREEAMALALEDPAVQAGRLVPVAHNWLGPDTLKAPGPTS